MTVSWPLQGKGKEMGTPPTLHGLFLFPFISYPLIQTARIVVTGGGRLFRARRNRRCLFELATFVAAAGADVMMTTFFVVVVGHQQTMSRLQTTATSRSFT